MVFQDNNSVSREEYWDDYSEDSEYNRERHGDPKHNRGATARSREERYSRSLLLVDGARKLLMVPS
jgi:hypothetical protein